MSKQDTNKGNVVITVEENKKPKKGNCIVQLVSIFKSAYFMIPPTQILEKFINLIFNLILRRWINNGKIKKIKVVSFAKFQAVLTTFVGLIAGILYSFGGLIGMPIVFAAFGFVVGLVQAFLYNLYASWFGGIEIDFEQ